jgi:transposase
MGLPDVFERRDSLTDVKAAYERQLEDLYAEIGRLTTHVNFLKKKLPS